MGNSELNWVKSSKSATVNDQDCVEVAVLPGGAGVGVRHSRQPGGAVIEYTGSEWRAFVDGVKAGEFDLP